MNHLQTQILTHELYIERLREYHEHHATHAKGGSNVAMLMFHIKMAQMLMDAINEADKDYQRLQQQYEAGRAVE